MADNKKTPVFGMDSVPIRGVIGNKFAKLADQLRQQNSAQTNNMQVSQPAKSLNNKSKK